MAVGMSVPGTNVMVLIGTLFLIRVLFRGLGLFRRPMLMKMKCPQQKEHGQHSHHHPPDDAIGRAHFSNGVRQHVDHPDAEHQPGNEADDQLQAKLLELEDWAKASLTVPLADMLSSPGKMPGSTVDSPQVKAF